jgi:predicted negative regulator of RcsB-dependent stress response
LTDQPTSKWRPTRRDLIVGLLFLAFGALAYDYYQIRTMAQQGAASYQFLTAKLKQQSEAQGKAEGK